MRDGDASIRSSGAIPSRAPGEHISSSAQAVTPRHRLVLKRTALVW
jgi:hypothetical protein